MVSQAGSGLEVRFLAELILCCSKVQMYDIFFAGNAFFAVIYNQISAFCPYEHSVGFVGCDHCFCYLPLRYLCILGDWGCSTDYTTPRQELPPSEMAERKQKPKKSQKLTNSLNLVVPYQQLQAIKADACQRRRKRETQQMIGLVSFMAIIVKLIDCPPKSGYRLNWLTVHLKWI